MEQFLKVLRKPNFQHRFQQKFQHKKFQQPQFWGLMLVGVAIALLLFRTKHLLFDQEMLLKALESVPCCAVEIFLGLYIILTIVGIPGTVLTTVGGILFGLAWGTFWSVIGATLGALGAFLVARYLLRDWAKRKFGNHPLLTRIERAIAKKPLASVLTLRFAPITPFNLINYLFGLTSVHWLTYTLGTFIGIIPGTLLYTELGVSGKTAIAGGDRLPFFLSLGALFLLSVVPPLLMKNKNFLSR